MSLVSYFSISSFLAASYEILSLSSSYRRWLRRFSSFTEDSLKLLRFYWSFLFESSYFFVFYTKICFSLLRFTWMTVRLRISYSFKVNLDRVLFNSSSNLWTFSILDLFSYDNWDAKLLFKATKLLLSAVKFDNYCLKRVDYYEDWGTTTLDFSWITLSSFVNCFLTFYESVSLLLKSFAVLLRTIKSSSFLVFTISISSMYLSA